MFFYQFSIAATDWYILSISQDSDTILYIYTIQIIQVDNVTLMALKERKPF